MGKSVTRSYTTLVEQVVRELLDLAVVLDPDQLVAEVQLAVEVFLMSQTRLFPKGPIGLLLSAIYTGKSLFLLGIEEPSRKKPHL